MTNKMDIHLSLCKSMHKVYEDKNADYGDSFAQLRKRYPNFVCMRLFDKLNRLDTLMTPGYEPKVSEKLEDTLMDIANYCIMELTERYFEEAEAAAKRCSNGAQSEEVTKAPSKKKIAEDVATRLQAYPSDVRHLIVLKLSGKGED